MIEPSRRLLPSLLTEASRLHRADRLDDALAVYRQAARLVPGTIDVEACLAGVLHDRGDLNGALAHYARALALAPKVAALHGDRGVAFRANGSAQDACQSLARALDLAPQNAGFLNNLGSALRDVGRLVEAERILDQAIDLTPGLAAAWDNRGSVRMQRGAIDAAISDLVQAAALAPSRAATRYNLANARRAARQLVAAIGELHRARALAPGLIASHHNLGHCLQEYGDIDGAVAAYRNALAIDPSFRTARSNLIFARLYDSAVGGDTLLSDHRSWGARHEGLPRARPARRARSSRIRVGYVSPDLCRHSISYFAEPLLERHDRRAVEVFCYADVKQPDDMTERFEHHASGWRSVVGWDDEAVAEKIRMDEIDVLVDLAGHTGDNRLGVFAMRPAPVQIAWLGYPFSTGLTAIDAMIGDHLLMPPGSTALEQIWRLDRPWVCYRAPSYAPDVTPVPAIRRGYATFGCFSNLAKINPHVVDVWAEILRRVPSARLVINNRWFADATIGESWRARFRHHDIQDDRVDFVATAPHDATLAYYAQIDVALDTFPFNGLTVTSEALWAGVPVVTLATSDRFVGRMGAALLDAIGLNRLIATTRGQYVEAATSLALDTDVLQVLRAGLRTRMSGSPLADEHGLARAMERAYHDMVALWAP